MRYHDLKEQMREANPIEDIVAETVPLPPQRNPQGYKIPCPFHPDAHPSLHVYVQSDSWWCYGCNRGGDVFDWIQRRDKVGFSEALSTLAARAGIPRPQHAAEPPAQLLKRRAIEDVLALAVAFYHQVLIPRGDMAIALVTSAKDAERYSADLLAYVTPSARHPVFGDLTSAMYDSFNLLKGLDDQLVVCPGHDYGPTPTSTLGEEKRENYTLEDRTREAFIRFMREP